MGNNIFKRMMIRLTRFKRGLVNRFIWSRNKHSTFTIISNNCWGGIVYQELGIPYSTPFVGLFICAPDYIRMISNLRYYLSQPLTFVETSRYIKDSAVAYPIAMLGDVEIHFQHYKNNSEVLDKWNRRLQRINWDNIYFKFCDRDFCEESHIREFDSLDIPNKVCFTAKEYPDLKSCVWIKEDSRSPYVLNEISHYERYFDIIKWLDH